MSITRSVVRGTATISPVIKRRSKRGRPFTYVYIKVKKADLAKAIKE